jgi:hypothetical protein
MAVCRYAATSIPWRLVGYPDAATFETDLIWLEQDEAEAYRQGQQIFGAVTASMKTRAEDPKPQTRRRSGE